MSFSMAAATILATDPTPICTTTEPGLIGTITDAPATVVNVTGDTGLAMIIARVVDGKDWMKRSDKTRKQAESGIKPVLTGVTGAE